MTVTAQSTLMFISYSESEPGFSMSHEPPQEVIVDEKRGVWKFPNRTRTDLEEFAIGSGIRVPEGHPFGPAFVYNPDNLKHRRAYMFFMRDLSRGALKP